MRSYWWQAAWCLWLARQGADLVNCCCTWAWLSPLQWLCLAEWSSSGEMNLHRAAVTSSYTPSPAYPWLWVFMGLFMTRSLGSRWMKTLLTQGDIRWVWGDRKWMLSTTTVTQMLLGQVRGAGHN